MEKEISIDELDVKLRSYVFLKKNGLMTLPALFAKLDEGIDELMKAPCITTKVAIDLLKAVKPFGYPSEELAEKYLATHRNDGSLSPEILALWEEMLNTLK